MENTLKHRDPLEIGSRAAKRRWSIRGEESFQGLALIEGDTEDLLQIVAAAQAWRDGATLDEVRRAAPFVHLTGRFEVPDGDPALLAESEWRHLLTEAHEPQWSWAPEYRALIEAAYAEPALRAFYPFTSHWTLRFSTSTRPRMDVVPVSMAADEGDRYTVCAPRMSDVIAGTSTAQAAVATAVRHLPAGLGPVTSGAAAGLS